VVLASAVTRSERVAELQPTAVNAISEMREYQAQGKTLVSLMRGNALQFDAGTEVLATAGSTFGIYAALPAVLNEGLEAAWSPAARMLILNMPWNSVGTVLTRQELTSFASGGDTLTHGLDRLSQGLARITEPNR
jgi:aspartate/methionine/tyrosine aminotransferase